MAMLDKIIKRVKVIAAIKAAAYKEGAQDAVSWLEEVYGDEIHETDAWAEYMGACDCHTTEEEEGN